MRNVELKLSVKLGMLKWRRDSRDTISIWAFLIISLILKHGPEGQKQAYDESRSHTYIDIYS